MRRLKDMFAVALAHLERNVMAGGTFSADDLLTILGSSKRRVYDVIALFEGLCLASKLLGAKGRLYTWRGVNGFTAALNRVAQCINCKEAIENCNIDNLLSMHNKSSQLMSCIARLVMFYLQQYVARERTWTRSEFVYMVKRASEMYYHKASDVNAHRHAYDVLNALRTLGAIRVAQDNATRTRVRYCWMGIV